MYILILNKRTRNICLSKSRPHTSSHLECHTMWLLLVIYHASYDPSIKLHVIIAVRNCISLLNLRIEFNHRKITNALWKNIRKTSTDL